MFFFLISILKGGMYLEMICNFISSVHGFTMRWNILTLNSGTFIRHNEAAVLFTSLSKTGTVMFNQRQQRGGGREGGRESQRWTDNRERGKQQTKTRGRRNHVSPNKSGTHVVCLCQSDWWWRLALVCLSQCLHFWEINSGCRSNPTKHDTTTGLDANQRRGWGWRQILCLGLEHGELALPPSSNVWALRVCGELVWELKIRLTEANPSRSVTCTPPLLMVSWLFDLFI